MKQVLYVITVVLALILLFNACETHQDPFSSLNNNPVIQVFGFSSDSLKLTAGEPFRIQLEYEDDEQQALTAKFSFISGNGDIFHPNFQEKERTNRTITFDIPSAFNDRINFIPDTTGTVEIELEISDKVKSTKRNTKTFVFANLNPIASFTFTLENNVNPYEVTLNASASRDRDQGGIRWFYWDFDDGSDEVRTASTTYQHFYQQSGRYTVQLRVEDTDGGVDSTEQLIATDNQAPLADLQVMPVFGEAPLQINYTATNSSDPDGNIQAYQIDFDDGTSATASAGSHTYTVDGNYDVGLTVTDNLGQTASTSIRVEVATSPVAVLNIAPLSGPYPLNSQINARGSFDPQGGIVDTDIFIDNVLVYDNIDSVLHTFDTPGNFLVKLVVTNRRNGLTSEQNRFVDAINLNPVADFTWAPANPQNGTPVTYTSISADPNQTDMIVNYKWTFPGGVIQEGPDASIVVQPYNAGVQPYPVTLEVTDSNGGVGTISRNIPGQ